jgi:hypothetical protein
MRLFVPKLGSQLKLTQDWSFNLYTEKRNSSLFPLVEKDEDWTVDTANLHFCRFYNCENSYEKLGFIIHKIIFIDMYRAPMFPVTCKKCKNSQFIMGKVPIEIPAGAILTVDRIYIRKTGAVEDFDSVSFYLDKDTARSLLQNPKLTARPRFWAKLDDVNNIHFDFVQENADESV